MITNIYLAPMAGVTDSPFRRICKSFGATHLTTEMVSAKGLYYKSKKTAELMNFTSSEHPVSIQLFGSDPDIMAEVAPILENCGADSIDINMGCPMPKIVNNGDGSALMKNPALAGKIVAAVKKAVNIPVTVKIRKGWDSDIAAEFAKILEDGGADSITVHARTKEQLYSGFADIDAIRKVKNAVNIPVIGNGDIFCPEDAKNMLEKTGCDGIMIGRGALGNPFIFRQITEFLEKGTVTYFPDAKDKISTALLHLEMLCTEKSEHRGVLEARKHIAWYLKGIPHSAEIKNRVFSANTLSQIQDILKSVPN